MARSAALILILNIFCVFSQIQHEVLYFVGCFVNGTTEIQFEFDGEEMLYVDFQREEVVYTVPGFIDPDPSQILLGLAILRDAIDNKELCHLLTGVMKLEEKSPPEEQDPPESMIFSAVEVEPGEENSLICFVNDFYPPSIKVSWTKNDQPVTEGVSLSRYYANNDQTFHQFSMLTFTPSEGDIYSCTVEHSALETPKTTFWEVEFPKNGTSFGPDIFCGVSLGLSLLGISIGIFFFVKGLNAQ